LALLFQPEPSAIEHQKNIPKVKAPEELSPFFETAKSLLQEHDEGKTKLNERIVKNLKRILLHDQIALFEVIFISLICKFL
jgi:acyl-CoA thioesterase